jgi:hypothetical protein
MVTAGLIDALVMCLMALLDSMPDTEVPDWVNSGANLIPTVFNFAGSMGVWFPWSTLAIVTAAVIGAWVLSFGIKIGRIIISHVTGGGGSAA